MSNYVQTTQFGPKDTLPLGNPSKLILGTQIDTELANIATAITSKYDASSIAAAPIGFQAGTAASPAVYFGSSANTGLYQAAANQIGVSIAGTAVALWEAAGLSITGTLTTTGNGTVGGALAVTGNATVGGTLGVTGAATLGPNSGVTAPAAGVAFTVNGGPTTAMEIIGDAGQFGLKIDSSASGALTGINITDSDVSWGMLTSVSAAGTLDFKNYTTGHVIASLQGNLPYIADDANPPTLQLAGYRGLPQISPGGTSFTLSIGYRGKIARLGAGYTTTVPHAVFSPGDVVTLLMTNSGVNTIAPDSGLTLYWANGTTTSTGSRSLTGYGLATIYFDSSTVAYITGSGLS